MISVQSRHLANIQAQEAKRLDRYVYTHIYMYVLYIKYIILICIYLNSYIHTHISHITHHTHITHIHTHRQIKQMKVQQDKDVQRKAADHQKSLDDIYKSRQQRSQRKREAQEKKS